MGTPALYKFFLTVFTCMGLSFAALANDEVRVVAVVPPALKAVTDTLPQQQNQKPPESTTEKPEAIIKEVPKSRKQVKPIAVTTATIAIKPVVVKPKIIVKPIIKLH